MKQQFVALEGESGPHRGPVAHCVSALPSRPKGVRQRRQILRHGIEAPRRQNRPDADCIVDIAQLRQVRIFNNADLESRQLLQHRPVGAANITGQFGETGLVDEVGRIFGSLARARNKTRYGVANPLGAGRRHSAKIVEGAKRNAALSERAPQFVQQLVGPPRAAARGDIGRALPDQQHTRTVHCTRATA